MSVLKKLEGLTEQGVPIEERIKKRIKLGSVRLVILKIKSDEEKEIQSMIYFP